jgi:hypothetical protein
VSVYKIYVFTQKVKRGEFKQDKKMMKAFFLVCLRSLKKIKSKEEEEEENS